MSGLAKHGEHIAVQRLTNADSDEKVILMWQHGKARTTAKTYETTIRQFRATLAKPLKTITLEELIIYQDSLRCYKITTANKKLAIVKSLFSFAAGIGYLTLNPAKVIKSINPAKAVEQQSLEACERIISESEVKAVLGAAKTQRDRIFLETIYLLGLRVHEAINLHWSNVLPSPAGGYRVKITGKGGRIRFNQVPDKLLNKWKSLQESDYIFQSNRNKQLGRTRAHLIMKSAVSNARLDKRVSIHWLRHAHASHSLKNGASLKAVQQQLGHSSIAITSVYLHDSESSSDYLNL